MDSRPCHPVYLSNITRVLGSIIREEVAKHGPVTVVVGLWRGLHNTSDSNYFYYIPDFLYACTINTIDHSKAVIQAAREFTQTRSKIRPVIGVRGERVLIDFKDNYKHCIEQLKALLLAVTNSTKTTRDNVHVFHDLYRKVWNSILQSGLLLSKITHTIFLTNRAAGISSCVFRSNSISSFSS